MIYNDTLRRKYYFVIFLRLFSCIAFFYGLKLLNVFIMFYYTFGRRLWPGCISLWSHSLRCVTRWNIPCHLYNIFFFILFAKKILLWNSWYDLLFAVTFATWKCIYACFLSFGVRCGGLGLIDINLHRTQQSLSYLSGSRPDRILLYSQNSFSSLAELVQTKLSV